jgi:hypothetical protein
MTGRQHAPGMGDGIRREILREKATVRKLCRLQRAPSADH